MLGVGLTNILGQQLLFVLGDRWSSPDLAAFYQPVTPCLTVAAALLLGMEAFSLFRVIGILIAGFGVLLISLATSPSSDASAGQHPLLANFVLLGNNICAMSGVLLQKPLNGHYSALMITAVAYACAVGGLLVVSITVFGAGGLEPSSFALDSHDAGLVIYVGVVCSALNYALITWANTVLEASIVSCYAVLQPVLTAVLAYMFLDEPPSGIVEVIGASLCIAGLVVTSVPPPSFCGGRQGAETLLTDLPPTVEHDSDSTCK